MRKESLIYLTDSIKRASMYLYKYLAIQPPFRHQNKTHITQAARSSSAPHKLEGRAGNQAGHFKTSTTAFHGSNIHERINSQQGSYDGSTGGFTDPDFMYDIGTICPGGLKETCWPAKGLVLNATAEAVEPCSHIIAAALHFAPQSKTLHTWPDTCTFFVCILALSLRSHWDHWLWI